MSDGLPTEEQLRRMEQRVMTRIRRRAQLPKRIATGAAVAAVIAGGVFLLPRVGTSSSGGSAGSAGYGSSESRASGSGSGGGSAALLAGCHASSSPKAAVLTVPLAKDTPSAAVDACLLALETGQGPTSSTASGSTASDSKGHLTGTDLVVCRDPHGRLQVFVKDAHPSTLCERNRMAAP